MNKNELVEGIAAKADLSKADAARAVAALTDIIAEALQKGDSLTLVGFGTFEVRSRAARTGRNPKTGEELKIAAAKVPAFKPGAALKAAVNGG
ncbi:bacterial nucleoid protein Hbs [Nitrosospira sp. Nsp11]|uniref:HU family DNA-binding protein n=1 Tax=Nitrosospira sp. Nsp11 TaxID=1855338 RepID=UPI000912EE23|nr:HU family DNA-binding protein [Nitrosospira sp. Nsp11]SHM15757.1 bacterial nucleoid protein Hbs [Nitrosospira sp. Nsp11]